MKYEDVIDEIKKYTQVLHGQLDRCAYRWVVNNHAYCSKNDVCIILNNFCLGCKFLPSSKEVD